MMTWRIGAPGRLRMVMDEVKLRTKLNATRLVTMASTTKTTKKIFVSVSINLNLRKIRFKKFFIGLITSLLKVTI